MPVSPSFLPKTAANVSPEILKRTKRENRCKGGCVGGWLVANCLVHTHTLTCMQCRTIGSQAGQTNSHATPSNQTITSYTYITAVLASQPTREDERSRSHNDNNASSNLRARSFRPLAKATPHPATNNQVTRWHCARNRCCFLQPCFSTSCCSTPSKSQDAVLTTAAGTALVLPERARARVMDNGQEKTVRSANALLPFRGLEMQAPQTRSAHRLPSARMLARVTRPPVCARAKADSPGWHAIAWIAPKGVVSLVAVSRLQKPVL
jgi:hypothetical protein